MKAILLKELGISPLTKEITDEQRAEALKVTKNNLQAINAALHGTVEDAYRGEVNQSVIERITTARDYLSDAIDYLHEIIENHHDPECE